MKIVALLSGGKDSIYNLLHCILNGHEPIAVASLGPGQGKDELDSYMYQTVGHSGLSLIAESLSLPLYARTITGTAVNQGNSYGSRSGEALTTKFSGEHVVVGEDKDETEDMYELLRDVKEKEPTVQGVAVGAILSNYQRVRVEQVCSRLGLVPIAYLWERNQADLLGEMVRAGMDSVLVKVAGAGLGVEHLGRSLKQMEPTLHRLNKKYQLHVCGEGGEYETFTVDCPIYKSRIVFKKTTTIISNSDPYSTVAHLHLDECILEPKPDHPQNETFEQLQARLRELVTIPPMLDRSSMKIYQTVRDSYRVSIPLESLSLEPRATKSECRPPNLIGTSPSQPICTTQGPWLHFSEIALPSTISCSNLSIEFEMTHLFETLFILLSEHSSTLLHLTHLTLYLGPESMALFPKINAIYSTYFGTAPPTRACVAILWPLSTDHTMSRIKLEGVAYNPNLLHPRTTTTSTLSQNRYVPSNAETDRQNLHVQSLSYWASANIGPYSQSITIDEKRSIFIAGQIGLVPKSLDLPFSSTWKEEGKGKEMEEEEEMFALETSLSLQHLRRILVASLSSSSSSTAEERGWASSVLCWVLIDRSIERGKEGQKRVYEQRLRGARKAWKIGYGQLRKGGQEDESDENVEEEDEADAQEDQSDATNRVPLLFISAEALPKGAKIEWQVCWESGFKQDVYEDEDRDRDDDDEDVRAVARPKGLGGTRWEDRRALYLDLIIFLAARPSTSTDLTLIHSEMRPSSHLLTILVGGSVVSEFGQARPDLPTALKGALLSMKLVHKPNVTREQIDRILSALLAKTEARSMVNDPDRPTISFICCERISTLERDDLDVVVLMSYALVQ
ncbi:BQ2448_6870 [Microbotryum intermedium]|uniref:Diphthine--ammonia ligase n=1 Tax=Microbotryum intermedium TaxID=269621 RepID=A0A238FIF5_9BASI|nr:BQ2448_6870 [Microbotryum intermedium]